MAEINITNAKDEWITSLVYGILLVAVGVCMIVFKQEALKWILIISGILMIISAAIELIFAIGKLHTLPVMPILSLILGVLLVVLPNFMADVLMILLGVILILYGILSVFAAIAGQKNGGAVVLVIGALIGVLAIAAGIYAILNNDDAADVVMIGTGVFTIVLGAIQIVGGINSYRLFR